MAISFDASGLHALGAAMDASTAKTGALTRAVVRKSALDVEAYAKQAAPVDTGNLRASIGHSDMRAMGTSGTIGVEVGPTANYGAFVEYGTSRMAPSAFMGPAMDRVAPGFTAAMLRVADL